MSRTSAVDMDCIEKFKPAELDIYGLESEATQQALSVLSSLLTACIGPWGKNHMVRNACGGHVTMTSTCVRFLNAFMVTRPELKLVVSSVLTHLQQHLDCGLFMACTCLELVRAPLMSQVHFYSTTAAYQCFMRIIKEYLKSPECPVCVKADYSDLRVLMAYVKSMLSSKYLLNLDFNSCGELCKLLLNTFVESIPPVNLPSRYSDGTFIIGMEKMRMSSSRMQKGLMLEFPEFPAIKGPVEIQTITIPRSGGDKTEHNDTSVCVRVALITCSMSGDVEEMLDVTYEATVSSCVAMEETIVRKMMAFCARLEEESVGVVLCQKVIHPQVKTWLRSKGIVFLDRLGSQPVPYIRDLTGASPIFSVVHTEGLAACLGWVSSVKHCVEGSKSYLLLDKPDAGVVTLILCAELEEGLAELKHCVKASFLGLRSLVSQPKMLMGGGCWQLHVSHILQRKVLHQLQEIADEVGCTKTQLLTSLRLFHASLHHWALSLTGSSHHLLVDPVSFHGWKVLRGRETNLNEGKVRCNCGLKSVSAKYLSEFELVLKLHNETGFTSRVSLLEDSCIESREVHENAVLDSYVAATESFIKAVLTANIVLSIGLFISDKN